jgi:hypothetical protein
MVEDRVLNQFTLLDKYISESVFLGRMAKPLLIVTPLMPNSVFIDPTLPINCRIAAAATVYILTIQQIPGKVKGFMHSALAVPSISTSPAHTESSATLRISIVPVVENFFYCKAYASAFIPHPHC